MAEVEVKAVEITLKNISTARQTFYDVSGKGVQIPVGGFATLKVPEAVRDSLKDSDLVELTTKSAAEAEQKEAKAEEQKEAKAEETAAKKHAAEEAAAASKRR